MRAKAGFAHLLVIGLVFLGVVVLLGYLLIRSGKILTFKKTSGSKPTVQLQTQYQNPFDKNVQYANPFSQYKNPFEVAK